MTLDSLFRPALAPVLVLLASVIVLGAALVSQYGFGLEPCVLCIWQRWPYVAAIALGAAGAALRNSPLLPWTLAAGGAALLIGSGIAVYHVGVEQHWWAGTAACTGGPTATTLEDLRAQLMGRPPVRCDEPAFVFLGLSMAGWNVLTAAGLGLFALVQGWRAAQERAA